MVRIQDSIERYVNFFLLFVDKHYLTCMLYGEYVFEMLIMGSGDGVTMFFCFKYAERSKVVKHDIVE